jgi:foldase protein PrsA
MRLIVPLMLALAALAGIALGCGGDDDLSDDAVAQVGDSMITKADYEEALRFATGRGDDPRDYSACVAAKERSMPEAGGTPSDEAELERQCRREYTQIKRNVMDYLIKAEWTRMEADERDISLPDAQVQQAFDEAQQGGFLSEEALRRAGVSESEMLGRVRHNQLQMRVREHLTEEARNISSQEIADYYRVNDTEFLVPDRRDLRIVITRTRAKAVAAREALESGRSWERVAAEFSVHISRSQGGKVTDALRGSKRKVGLGAAIFGAQPGKLMGPVQDDDGWAVFVVDEIKPAYQPTLEQARAEVTERLQAAREKQALDAFTRKYRKRTTCAPGFVVAACENSLQTGAQASF